MKGYDGNKHVKGSKIHAVVSGDGSLPINVILGPANEHDSRKLFPLIDKISIATKAHRSRKEETERSIRRSSLRQVSSDALSFKEENKSSVERFFGWLKGGFRRLEVRYERDYNRHFFGLIQLACFIIHWSVFG
jgi:hypothetical protein